MPQHFCSILPHFGTPSKDILYAEDVALLFSCRSVGLIEEKVGNELSSLNRWLVDNRLSIYLGKTEYILFRTKSKLRINSEIKVTCGGTHVAAKQSVRSGPIARW